MISKMVLPLLIIAATLFSQDFFGDTTTHELPHLTYSLHYNKEHYTNGDTATIEIRTIIPAEHHLYGNPLGPGIGKPTTLTPLTTQGLTYLSVKAPRTDKFTPPGMEEQWVWSWHDTISFYITALITNSDSLEAQLELDGLICKDACIPVYDSLSLFPRPLTTSPLVESSNLVPFPLEGVATGYKEIDRSQEVPQTSPTETTSMSLWVAILLAFVAGIILNFMPCVLPVLGLKIMTFSQGRTQSKKDTILHSVAFAAGMILVFIILALVAIGITHAGSSYAWGQQFQSATFTIAVIAMIFVFGLGMFDLFIILVPNKVSELDQKQDHGSLTGNFFKGIFATILATPCSGPLLGGVLAWALSGQPSFVILLVFTAIGLGMASPYLLLASFDSLSRLIPKPGAWMEDFKHFLGFVMFGFALWLLSTLATEYIIPTLALILTLTFAVMLYGRIAPFGSSLIKKSITALLLLLLIAGVSVKLFEKHENVWQEFSETTLNQAIEEKKDIIIEFTANWCLNCQYNKSSVYNTDDFQTLLSQKGIVPLRADLTQSNPVAEKYRDQFGSKSIPFLVIIPQGDISKMVRIRDLVTKSQVEGALEDL